MSLSYPLTRAAFMDRLPVVSCSFRIVSQRQSTGLEGGEILSSEVAPAYWAGQVRLAAMGTYQAQEAAALLGALERPGASFEVYEAQRYGPKADPRGTTTSGGGTISSHNISASTLALSGLPGGFQVAVGDYVSFAYASGARQALHRYVQAGSATSALTVEPPLQPGLTNGTAAALVRPWCRAQLVPGGLDAGETALRITSGLSFSFRQSLR